MMLPSRQTTGDGEYKTARDGHVRKLQNSFRPTGSPKSDVYRQAAITRCTRCRIRENDDATYLVNHVGQQAFDLVWVHSLLTAEADGGRELSDRNSGAAKLSGAGLLGLLEATGDEDFTK